MTGLVLPRIAHFPDAPSSSGADFGALYEFAAGHPLDPWQLWTLDKGLGETGPGKWASFQNTIIIPRQNGKDEIFVALGLGWLFLTGERLIGHSAHEYKTAMEAYRRLVGIIQNCPSLHKRVKKYINTNGEEGIELVTGQRMRFLARSKGAGRGFSFDKMIWNEAYALTAPQVDAVLPALSARPNPQIWLGSSPPLDPGTGEALFRARRNAGAAGTMYLDWGAEGSLDALDLLDLDDPDIWARVNPAYPHRIPREAIERERAAMDAAGFARERLGVWPPDLSEGFTVITKAQWDRLEDQYSGKGYDQIPATMDYWPDPATPASDPAWRIAPTELVGRPVFALSTSARKHGPVRSTISLAQRRQDGKAHLEVVITGAGSSWVPDALVKLAAHKPAAVIVDPGSPAGASIADIEAKGVSTTPMSTRDVAQAFGMIYDAATSETPDGRTVAHLGQSEATLALQGAGTRDVGDGGRAWDVRKAGTDITPIDSMTRAFWGLATHGSKPEAVAPWVMYA